MRVSIGGLPGSGTSTAAYLLAEKTGLEVVSAGEVFRQMAKEQGVSLAKFGKIAQKDENIDRGLDRRMLEIAKKRDTVILEGRLIGALCKKEEIETLAVWLESPRDIRAQRISQREGEDMAKTVQEMAERENSERTRYLRFYGLDMEDPSIYDAVIDSHKHNPPEIVELIMEAM